MRPLRQCRPTSTKLARSHRISTRPASVRTVALALTLLLLAGPATSCSSTSRARAAAGRAPGTTTGEQLGPTTIGTAEPTTDATEPDTTSTTSLVTAACDGDLAVSAPGTLATPTVTEASGLAASRAQPGLWWTHNDSGGKAELYGFDESGRLLAVVSLTGADARDWEDIAIARDRAGRDRIYVGDIGDNGGKRDTITIYALTPPAVKLSPTEPPGAQPEPQRLKVTPERFELRYPDGPRDAEALLVEPTGPTVYIISKDWSLAGRSGIYRASLAGEPAAGAVELERVGELELPPASLVTAADLSPDGTALAVRAYGTEHLFARQSGQSIIDALRGTPCTGPTVPEALGEAIAFAADGRSYMTLAEGENPTLHRISPDR